MQTEYILIGIGALLVLLVLYPTIRIRTDKNIRNIGGAEAASLVGSTKNLVIIDVRTKEEFRSGHIQGAKNIPLGELPSRMGELAKYKGNPLLVHCASGSRSAKAVLLLSKNGFAPVNHLRGGLSAWPGPLKK